VVPSRGHSPTLDTQLMVEHTIRDRGSFPSRRALMRELAHKVEYGTLVRILQYLEASEKIVLTEDGSIAWVFADNPKLLALLDQSPILAKPRESGPEDIVEIHQSQAIQSLQNILADSEKLSREAVRKIKTGTYSG